MMLAGTICGARGVKNARRLLALGLEGYGGGNLEVWQGGGRADVFLEGPGGKIIEIDGGADARHA
jgi:hypothetical protein